MFKRVIFFICIFGILLMTIGCSEKITIEEESEKADLVIAYAGMPEHFMQLVGEAFAEETGLKVEFIAFRGNEGSEIQELDVMLMSKSTRVDVFYTDMLDISKYVRSGYYVDLGQYDNLNNLIESNELVKFVSEYNGQYFGVPAFPENENKYRVMFSSPERVNYCIQNINAFEGTYSDPDGEKLYELLKYVYEKDGDIYEYPLEEVDYSLATCSGYVVMSPFSEHKDVAAMYMEYVFNHLKDAPPVPYPEGVEIDKDNTYLEHVCIHPMVVQPITDAFKEAVNTDGSDEALHELACEAARQVRMRLEG